MGRPAKWKSTRKRVAFAPTTTTTIEPDGALVLLPESAHAGERRRRKPSPLDLSSTAVPEISQSRSILSVQRHRMLGGVEVAAPAALSRNAPAGDLRVCGLQRGK